MNARSNLKLDAFHRKVDEFRERLSQWKREHPESGLRVVKRSSGPHLGPWHEPAGQAEMILRDKERSD